jgi:hypothetical protein
MQLKKKPFYLAVIEERRLEHQNDNSPLEDSSTWGIKAQIIFN